jgi:hypothetical protein
MAAGDRSIHKSGATGRDRVSLRGPFFAITAMTQQLDSQAHDTTRPADIAAAAEGRLLALTDEVYQRNVGRPGARPSKGPSLAKLDPSTRRLVQVARARGTPVSVHVFKNLVRNAGLSGQSAVPLVYAYIEATLLKDFARCMHLFEDLFVDDQRQAITTTGEFKAVIRVEPVDARATSDLFQRMRQDIAKHPHMFGWVTDANAGLKILAPTAPVCALLDLDVTEFDGSYSLEQPLLSRLQERAVNFAEWALSRGMLYRTLLPSLSPSAAVHVQQYFTWLATYAATKDASAAIDRAPEIERNGRPSRGALEQCLRAALGKADWPVYSVDRYNTVCLDLCVGPGRIARFEEVYRPIEHLGALVGFEVTWSPNHFDTEAVAAMSAIVNQMEGVEQRGTANHVVVSDLAE